MLIGIVGHGVVGKAIDCALSSIGHTVKWYDKFISNSSSLEELVAAECIFICVPTDTVNGICDITNVTGTILALDTLNYNGLIIIKSTVIPGTTQHFINQFPHLKISFVPEFLREDRALCDFMSPTNTLIVGTLSATDFELITTLHKPFSQTSVKITPTEAEVVKYFSNNFNALRIVFANTYYEVCNLLGADYSKVLESAVTLSSIGNDSYLKCNKNLRGYKGRCLPKDIESFNMFVKSMGLPSSVLEAVIKDNKIYEKK
jgi:UDPglucose 6-dehydrogenase